MNLINLKTLHMQVFIHYPVECSLGSKMAFIKKETKGYSLNWCGTLVDSENKHFDLWYEMSLKDDFFNALRAHGRLPEPTFQASLNEIGKVSALEDEKKRLLAFIEQNGLLNKWNNSK